MSWGSVPVLNSAFAPLNCKWGKKNSCQLHARKMKHNRWVWFAHLLTWHPQSRGHRKGSGRTCLFQTSECGSCSSARVESGTPHSGRWAKTPTAQASRNKPMCRFVGKKKKNNKKKRVCVLTVSKLVHREHLCRGKKLLNHFQADQSKSQSLKNCTMHHIVQISGKCVFLRQQNPRPTLE